ncbi:hypothetical protein CALCODRAFT_481048 [Calocera cornea HHB12733]|uniref:Uncharacterized protein n=1 Tax=Calocera cornea HHB12733 TaxID=1353952 RepID=A0A165HZV5_9BASI|nr:hypothetical protein CALCODRAFT_481048 [Calocera cornea HHB12733]
MSMLARLPRRAAHFLTPPRASTSASCSSLHPHRLPQLANARRTIFKNPPRDPSVPPTYAELEQEARLGRLRVVVVTLPLVIVCGYMLYRRIILGEEQRRLAWEELGGEPPSGTFGVYKAPPAQPKPKSREEGKMPWEEKSGAEKSF